MTKEEIKKAFVNRIPVTLYNEKNVNPIRCEYIQGFGYARDKKQNIVFQVQLRRGNSVIVAAPEMIREC